MGGESLSVLNRGTGSNEPSVFVYEAIITKLLEWLGVTWSSLQIRETAQLASGEYHWMTLAEIKAFTAKVKLGHFGKEFGKLRPMLLMNWLLTWATELLETRASMRIENKKKVVLPADEIAVDGEPETNREVYISEASPEIQAEFHNAITELTNAMKARRQEAAGTIPEKRLKESQEKIAARQVIKFVDAIVAGRQMTNAEDLQFYENNKQMIELLLKLRNTSHENKISE